MLRQFLDFLEKEQLPGEGSRALLAVSGGVDSIAMAHLFREAKLEFGIAHCNFQLRAEASDEDERFVLALAREWGVGSYSQRFDTTAYAGERGLSIQVAARELRYTWLEEMRREHAYTHIATAHHLNDSIETLLYNLAKGCGIRGLHGIPVQNGLVVRPLLFASREQIVRYVEKEGLPYREDASNLEDKYARNKIRHHIIPAFQAINPGFEQAMAANIGRFRQLEHLLGRAMYQIAQDAIISYGHPFRLRTAALADLGPALPTVLFELLNPYGFNSSQAQQLAASLGHTGAVFMAPEYRLLVEREEIVVESIPEPQKPEVYLIREGESAIQLPDGILQLQLHTGRPPSFSGSEWECFLDADSLQFPLALRRWQAGDSFQPLGMEGHHQKLQDFFNNQKTSRFEKERIWVAEDAAGRICWIIGYRIDERFKVKPATRAYWALNFKKG